MSMERLPFEHRPRNSIANNLDKINELIDWANQDTYLYASASGERVTADDASSLKGLMVDGRSVQDGTPTPDTPVAVQVVEGPLSLVIGNISVPINLQGNMLASLPDGTHDELHIDSAGHVWIEKRVGYVSTNDLSANVAGAAILTNFVRIVCSGALTDNPAPANSTALNRNGFCNVVPFTGAGYSSDTLHAYAHLTGFYLFAPIGDKSTWEATTAAEWITEHGAYAYYTPAATTTIDLGYITPPAIPSGSVVTVSASLTPTFHLEWWVDDGITELVNDLIAYIDYKTEG